MPLRRDYSRPEDCGEEADRFGEEWSGRRKHGDVRPRLIAGVVPKTAWGRAVAACALLVVTAGAIAALIAMRSYLLRDEHFLVRGPSSIQIQGNSHLTRPQLLSVFGGDVERNVFRIPLEQRRQELELLPWVEHATVMRLLPNRVRVRIVERTPVAFVRQGTKIDLADANGVLLDMGRAPDDPEEYDAGRGAGDAHSYSFPVLSGIAADDPLSTRSARMKIYLQFLAALDAGGDKVSAKLSEVDVSNPEDVKANLLDAGSAGPDILVHFGDERFLERYRQYQQHLTEWRTLYPKLASVDMRYERQVVLEMQPGTAVAATAATAPERLTPLKAPTPAVPTVVGRANPTPQSRELSAVPAQGVGHPQAVAHPPTPTAAAVPAAPVKHLMTAYPVSSGHLEAPLPIGHPSQGSAPAGASTGTDSAVQGRPR